MCNELSLCEYVKQLPSIHRARKEYDNLLMALSKDHDPYGDLIASNIEVQRDIARRTMQYIKQMCSEAMSTHPHHPDSYPRLLGILQAAKKAPDVL